MPARDRTLEDLVLKRGREAFAVQPPIVCDLEMQTGFDQRKEGISSRYDPRVDRECLGELVEVRREKDERLYVNESLWTRALWP